MMSFEKDRKGMPKIDMSLLVCGRHILLLRDLGKLGKKKKKIK